MADSQVTISLDVILRGIEIIIVPLIVWLFRNAWREFKGTIRNINVKVESTNVSVSSLAGNFNEFRLDVVDRLARLETHAENERDHSTHD